MPWFLHTAECRARRTTWPWSRVAESEEFVKRCSWIVVLAFLLTSSIFAASKAAKMSNEDCLACHNDATLTKDENGKQVSLHVDDAKFKASIHSVFGCTDCHTDIKAFPHDPTPAKPVCATCHADQQTAYDHGVHAKAAAAGNTNVAKCQDCHGSVHEILPASDPKSKVARGNIPQTCGACHGQKFVMASSGMSSAPFNSYQQSVHGKAVAAGSDKAAVCTDCHGEHDILAGDRSQVADQQVQRSRHLRQVPRQHQAGVRAKHPRAGDRARQLAGAGVHRLPRHSHHQGAHAIPIPRWRRRMCGNTCAQCHGSVRCPSEFGMPADRVTTYLSSYHGMASKVGSTTVANCASCHGVHNILPSSDPRSTINHANLAKTCGQVPSRRQREVHQRQGAF